MAQTIDLLPIIPFTKSSHDIMSFADSAHYSGSFRPSTHPAQKALKNESFADPYQRETASACIFTNPRPKKSCFHPLRFFFARDRWEVSPDSLWPPAHDLDQLGDEVCEEGDGEEDVEDAEHLAPVSRAVDVAVADLKKGGETHYLDTSCEKKLRRFRR